MRILEPLSMLSFLRVAAENGVLIKDARALERLSSIDTIVFDKTGTLTLEQPRVREIHSQNAWPEEEVRLAGAAEQRQSHPIARAILLAAEDRGIELPPLSGARYEMGFGIKVTIEGQVVRVGSARFLNDEGIALPDTVMDLQARVHEHGHSLVLVGIGELLAGAIELEPAVRSEARQIVADLKKRGRKLYIISGDHEEPTKALAQRLGWMIISPAPCRLRRPIW